MSDCLVSAASFTAKIQGSGAGNVGDVFEAQKLYTSQDMTWQSNSGVNSVEWITNEFEPFAQITWSEAGGTAGLLYSFADRNSDHYYVSFYVRRRQIESSKNFKMLGQDIGGLNNMTAGVTGTGYSGTEMRLSYGDRVSGSNDSQTIAAFNNTLVGGSSYTRAAPTLVYGPTANVNQDISGSVWQRYEYYWKYNSDDTADGEFGAAIDGVRVFQLANMYNCANGGQKISRIGLGEYSNAQAVPVVEDYKRLDIGYARPDWMTS